ncbi:hypothetical protein MRB53_038365 [Persea americana]|nr:hypothetical protein MRB53_038365 [Persea americana]
MVKVNYSSSRGGPYACASSAGSTTNETWTKPVGGLVDSAARFGVLYIHKVCLGPPWQATPSTEVRSKDTALPIAPSDR